MITTDRLASFFSSVKYDPNELTDLVKAIDGEVFLNNFAKLDAEFALDELGSAIVHLKTGKAPGPNGITSEVFEALFKGLRSCIVLLRLFNLCFQLSVVPEQWRAFQGSLPYKGKGSAADPENYRAIALLDISSKIFETLIYNRVKNWAEREGIISPLQFGFRAGRSTTDLVFAFKTMLTNFLVRRGILVFMCFVALMRAFPSVHRRKLMEV